MKSFESLPQRTIHTRPHDNKRRKGESVQSTTRHTVMTSLSEMQTRGKNLRLAEGGGPAEKDASPGIGAGELDL